MAAKGKIAAEGAAFGPTDNTAFSVDRVTGQVDFKLGTPTPTVAEQFPALGAPTYSTLPSTGIDANTKNTDSVNILVNWISSYLLDSPPAPTITSSSSDTEKIVVNFTPPPQKRTAFTDSSVPNIQYLRADVVASSLNASQDWSHASKQTFTLESPVSTAFVTVTALELYVQAGTSALSGATYQARNIVTEVLYDIRLYGLNRSTQPTKYAYVYGVATLPVGAPAAPTGLIVNTPTTSSLQTSWTAPADRDVNTEGTQSSPFIATYKVSREATASVRYGGVITDTGDSYTTTTTVSDSASSLSITSLHPGTTYSFTVAAKNTINPSYGSAITPAVTSTTSFPTAPSYLSTSDASSLDSSSLTTLRGTYSSSGGYSLDGTTLNTPVINYNLMTDSNVKVTLVSGKRTNFSEGATGTVGTLVAYGGPSASYTSAENTASFDVQGFGTTTADGNVTSTSGVTRLLYTSDGDSYSAGSTDQKGFYKIISMQAQGYGVATNFPASQSAYSLRMQYTPVGGSQVQTPQVQFWVDSLNAATAVNNLGIIAETNSATTRISGVPTFTSTAIFKGQWCQTNVAAYFLRYDKRHADVMIATSGGSTIGATSQVYASSMGASHKYYTAPSTKYNTSTTLHNTSGLVIAASTSPAELQFNDFTFPLTAGTNLFDENVQVKVTPYSIYSNGGGTQVAAGYVDPATGTAKLIRIDTKSVAADRSSASNATSSLGQHMASSTGTYPASGYTSGYDHSVDITTTSDLQLVNGTFQTPAFSSNGYKSYSGFWASSLSMPNYSSISSSASTMRYVTFKYTNFISSSTYNKIILTVVHSGLMLDISAGTANHSLAIKIVDSNGTYSTPWYDTTKAIAGTGLTGSDGGANGDVSSTVGTRNCYIMNGSGSTCTAYVRLGLSQNVAASLTSINLAAVTTF